MIIKARLIRLSTVITFALIVYLTTTCSGFASIHTILAHLVVSSLCLLLYNPYSDTKMANMPNMDLALCKFTFANCLQQLTTYFLNY